MKLSEAQRRLLTSWQEDLNEGYKPEELVSATLPSQRLTRTLKALEARGLVRMQWVAGSCEGFGHYHSRPTSKGLEAMRSLSA